ncbi:MAG: hypothetical protein ABIH90_02265, partial [Candidatus Aenigmatarchaeota archaeon]
MMEIHFDPNKGIWADDPETVDKLDKNFFGHRKGNIILLKIEEALYLISFLNARCIYRDKEMSFNELTSHFPKEPRLFIRYNAYRDWRDRGLVIVRSSEVKNKGRASGALAYPSKPFHMDNVNSTVQWDSDSFFSIMDDDKTAKTLFNGFWFGQYGIYKQDRGDLLKLNFLETVFLSKHAGIHIKDSAGNTIFHKKLLDEITSKREYANQMYDVYEDWRLSGFVIKTGFKFGSHFRIY